MLNFRNTNILFIILLVALATAQYFNGFDVSWFIALALLYLAFIFYGSFYIRSNFFLKSFSGIKTDEKIISLTFDDGPSSEYSLRILEILKEHQVPAAFFVIGENVEENKALLQQIADSGSIIGNHTFYHSNWFDLQSAKNMCDEMQQTHDLVHQLTGKQMNWFRPPYGVTNPNVKKAIERMEYMSIGWNIRSFDTVIRDPAKLLHRLKRLIKPGAIILLHDTQEITTEVLPDFLQFVKEQQYKVIPLDKLLALQAYKIS